MFSQACVIFCSWGGVSASVHAGIPPPSPEQTPPQSRHPLGADTPRADTPPSRHPPRADTPWSRPPSADTPLEQTPRSRHPLEQTPPKSRHPQSRPPQEQTPPPQHRACWEIRSMCGQYASYWNAILFVTSIQRITKQLLRVGCWTFPIFKYG